MTLGLSNRAFFLTLIAFLIPVQVFLNWFYDIFIARNAMSLSLGFSAILYGIDAFILLASIYGKQTFLGVQIGLRSNYQENPTNQAFQVESQLILDLRYFYWPHL